MKANRFAGFADEDQVANEVKQQQQQVKQQEQAKKKVVVQVKKEQQHVEDAHEFEKVADKGQPQRGGRGGRGDRGRGGRGGRGGDRPQTAGERGGDRRRGRGDRPQTAKPVVAEAGLEGEQVEKKEKRAERGGRGRGPRYEGKAREDAHPMDRQDGTGRGRRGDRKGGHGKGNWGKEDKEAKKDDGAEESKEEKKPRREREEKKVEEPQPVEEEEEEGFTLDDFMAAKQAKSQGLAVKKEARAHEKGEMKNVKDLDYKHDEMATTKIYKKADTVTTSKFTGGELLGFQGQVDAGDEFESRGKRGGRGGQGPRPDRQEGGQRRRKGKIVNDDDFPTL